MHPRIRRLQPRMLRQTSILSDLSHDCQCVSAGRRAAGKNNRQILVAGGQHVYRGIALPADAASSQAHTRASIARKEATAQVHLARRLAREFLVSPEPVTKSLAWRNAVGRGAPGQVSGRLGGRNAFALSLSNTSWSRLRKKPTVGA